MQKMAASAFLTALWPAMSSIWMRRWGGRLCMHQSEHVLAFTHEKAGWWAGTGWWSNYGRKWFSKSSRSQIPNPGPGEPPVLHALVFQGCELFLNHKPSVAPSDSDTLLITASSSSLRQGRGGSGIYQENTGYETGTRQWWKGTQTDTHDQTERQLGVSTGSPRSRFLEENWWKTNAGTRTTSRERGAVSQRLDTLLDHAATMNASAKYKCKSALCGLSSLAWRVLWGFLCSYSGSDGAFLTDNGAEWDFINQQRSLTRLFVVLSSELFFMLHAIN